MLDNFANRTLGELKLDETALRMVLEDGGAVFKGRACRCIFCDDRRPSAGIYSSNGSGFSYKCHSCGFGGDIADVLGKLRGVAVAEVLKGFKHNSSPHRQLKPKVYPDIAAISAILPGTVHLHRYTNPVTRQPDLLIFRCEEDGDKTFRQCHLVSNGYVLQGIAKPYPIYNRIRILKARRVVVCEGETCVERLQGYGIVATTSVGGAGKASHADWGPLRSKEITLWPDCDPPGRQHMKDVQACLQALNPAPSISVIEPTDLDLQDKDDVVDYIRQLEVLHQDKATITKAILDAVGKARSVGAFQDMTAEVDGIESGKINTVSWPWSKLTEATLSLGNGRVIVICGSGGAGKSLFVIQCLRFWLAQGIRAAVLELENDKKYHLFRALSQESGCVGMATVTWIKAHLPEARQILETYKGFVDELSPSISEKVNGLITLDDVGKWIEAKAAAGNRLVAVDPVTHTVKDAKPWIADNRFLQQAMASAKRHACTVLLVTHPTKGSQGPGLDTLAGASDYARHTDGGIWIERHGGEGKKSKVQTACGTDEAHHSHTVHILKSRDSWGAGFRLAYDFDKTSLALHEIGIIARKRTL